MGLSGDVAPGEYITSETASKAARLFINFVIPNMIMFYHDVIGDSEKMHNVRSVAGYILANGLERVTSRDIYRAHRSLRDDIKLLNDTMSHLELAGWVSPDLIPGKQPKAWRINPRVHIEFAELAKKEHARRERIKEEIQKIAQLSRVSLEDSADVNTSSNSKEKNTTFISTVRECQAGQISGKNRR